MHSRAAEPLQRTRSELHHAIGPGIRCSPSRVAVQRGAPRGGTTELQDVWRMLRHLQSESKTLEGVLQRAGLTEEANRWAKPEERSMHSPTRAARDALLHRLPEAQAESALQLEDQAQTIQILGETLQRLCGRLQVVEMKSAEAWQLASAAAKKAEMEAEGRKQVEGLQRLAQKQVEDLEDRIKNSIDALQQQKLQPQAGSPTPCDRTDTSFISEVDARCQAAVENMTLQVGMKIGELEVKNQAEADRNWREASQQLGEAMGRIKGEAESQQQRLKDLEAWVKAEIEKTWKADTQRSAELEVKLRGEFHSLQCLQQQAGRKLRELDARTKGELLSLRQRQGDVESRMRSEIEKVQADMESVQGPSEQRCQWQRLSAAVERLQSEVGGGRLRELVKAEVVRQLSVARGPHRSVEAASTSGAEAVPEALTSATKLREAPVWEQILEGAVPVLTHPSPTRKTRNEAEAESRTEGGCLACSGLGCGLCIGRQSNSTKSIVKAKASSRPMQSEAKHISFRKEAFKDQNEEGKQARQGVQSDETGEVEGGCRACAGLGCNLCTGRKSVSQPPEHEVEAFLNAKAQREKSGYAPSLLADHREFKMTDKDAAKPTSSTTGGTEEEKLASKKKEVDKKLKKEILKKDAQMKHINDDSSKVNDCKACGGAGCGLCTGRKSTTIHRKGVPQDNNDVVKGEAPLSGEGCGLCTGSQSITSSFVVDTVSPSSSAASPSSSVSPSARQLLASAGGTPRNATVISSASPSGSSGSPCSSARQERATRLKPSTPSSISENGHIAVAGSPKMKAGGQAVEANLETAAPVTISFPSSPQSTSGTAVRLGTAPIHQSRNLTGVSPDSPKAREGSRLLAGEKSPPVTTATQSERPSETSEQEKDVESRSASKQLEDLLADILPSGPSVEITRVEVESDQGSSDSGDSSDNSDSDASDDDEEGDDDGSEAADPPKIAMAKSVTSPKFKATIKTAHTPLTSESDGDLPLPE